MKALNAGADPNVVDQYGYTPLMIAALDVRADLITLEVFKELLNAGADPNLVEGKGYTPLMYAAFNGRVDLVKALCEHVDRDKFINAQNRAGRSALAVALSGYSTATQTKHIFQELFNAGAKPNLADHLDWTPLMHAADCGRADLVSLLLNNGGDPHQLNNNGWRQITIWRRRFFVYHTYLRTS